MKNNIKPNIDYDKLKILVKVSMKFISLEQMTILRFDQFVSEPLSFQLIQLVDNLFVDYIFAPKIFHLMPRFWTALQTATISKSDRKNPVSRRCP